MIDAGHQRSSECDRVIVVGGQVEGHGGRTVLLVEQEGSSWLIEGTGRSIRLTREVMRIVAELVLCKSPSMGTDPGGS
jgi:hypothetical protein